MDTSDGATGTYAEYLAGLDREVRFQLERYANQPEGNPLGYLYNSTLASEVKGYTDADGATEVRLPDFAVKNIHRHADYQHLIDQIQRSPRGTWVLLTATWDNGETTGTSRRFIMSTGGKPYLEGSGHGTDWTYDQARARLLESEIYYSRARCDATILAERNEALRGHFTNGMTLKALSIGGALFSTAVITAVDGDGTVSLHLTKPGSSRRYTKRASPVQVQAMLDDGQARIQLRAALRARKAA